MKPALTVFFWCNMKKKESKNKSMYYKVSWNLADEGIESKIFPAKEAVAVYNALIKVSKLLFIEDISIVKE